jgi:DNA polymerase-1
MMEAYVSGDPYLAFAKQADAVPEWATKKSHGPQRELFKTCVLGVQYGMGANTLAERISGGNQYPHLTAKDLLQSHRKIYSAFWRWSDLNQDHAMLKGFLQTVFGWHVYTARDQNPRSMRNFPVQSNGAEMLRIAACLATEQGIEVIAPVHDALMILAPIERLDEDIARMQEAMVEASRVVLGGFELRTDAQVVRYPDRFMDERGAVMWHRVMALIEGERASVQA